MKKLSKTSRNFEALRNVRPKQLRMEALEDRRMLSATDIAALDLANSAVSAEVAPSGVEQSAIDLSVLGLAETSGETVEKQALATPKVSIESIGVRDIGNLNAAVVTFSWEPVEGAARYNYSFTTSGYTYDRTTTGTSFEAVALIGNKISLSVTAVPAADSAQYVNSQPFTTEVTAKPAIVFATPLESVDHDAIGTVVATFEAIGVDASDLVLTDNGAATDLFKIEGNTIVVANSLLNAAQPHKLQLSATLDVFGAIKSEEISVAVSGKLTTPTVTLKTAAIDSLVFNCSAVEGATGYRYQYGVTGQELSEPIYLDAADYADMTEFELTFDNLNLGTDYTLSFSAFNEVSGITSDAATVNASTSVPSIALTQTVESVDHAAIGTVVATFDAEGVDAGNIVLTENGGAAELFKIEGNTIVVANSLLNVAQPHKLQLSAEVDGYGAVASEEISVAVSGKLTQPTVTVSSVDETSIAVAWDAVDGATGYVVAINGEEGVNVSETSKTFTGLTPDTAYAVSVIAVNSVSGIKSDPGGVEQKTAPAPSITVWQEEAVVKYSAVGTVVASFEANFDDSAIVVYEDGLRPNISRSRVIPSWSAPDWRTLRGLIRSNSLLRISLLMRRKSFPTNSSWT